MEIEKIDFKKMKNIIVYMQEQNYKSFIKAIISAEKGIEDEKILEENFTKNIWIMMT